MKYVLTAIYILLTTGGLYCFKLGGDSLSLSLKGEISFKVGFVTFLGLLLYIGSFLLWQKLLATYDIVPITTGIVQVIVLIMGYFIFKESVSALNFMGIILVIIGVILISIKH